MPGPTSTRPRPGSPTAAQRLRLRPWQREALDRYSSTALPDFLAVATPGAGKTMFALTAARLTLPRTGGRLVVVAPTRHLKLQWAAAAETFGLHLDADWSPGARLPADVHGIVTTYQQVATAAPEVAALVAGGMAILDEVHHAGDDLAWGDGVTVAFATAARRLALSGTPFRSDTAAIPFLNYVGEQVVPDVEYGYGDALGDGGVVRPVYFPRFGGHMEWTAPDGTDVVASFDDALPRSLANQRLRAALSLDGEWLPTVLRHANQQLLRLRDGQPDAGGLVIASDQDHAHAIARLFRDRFGVLATVAVSEDADASAKIARFANATDPWIVAVRMVSEGVDIPRLRVGVHATTTTTELFFRQAVGRIVRYTGDRGRAYMYLPDDPRLRHYASSIAETRRHRLERLFDSEDEQVRPDDDAERPDNDEQLSLFAVHSSTATEAEPAPDHDPDDILAVHDEPGLVGPAPATAELVLDLTALPPVPGVAVGAGGSGAGGGRAAREQQRSINAQWARDLATLTGMTHAKVNAELNRLSGVARVSEATVDQLERRAEAAARWFDQASRQAARPRP